MLKITEKMRYGLAIWGCYSAIKMTEKWVALEGTLLPSLDPDLEDLKHLDTIGSVLVSLRPKVTAGRKSSVGLHFQIIVHHWRKETWIINHTFGDFLTGSYLTNFLIPKTACLGDGAAHGELESPVTERQSVQSLTDRSTDQYDSVSTEMCHQVIPDSCQVDP